MSYCDSLASRSLVRPRDRRKRQTSQLATRHYLFYWICLYFPSSGTNWVCVFPRRRSSHRRLSDASPLLKYGLRSESISRGCCSLLSPLVCVAALASIVHVQYVHVQ